MTAQTSPPTDAAPATDAAAITDPAPVTDAPPVVDLDFSLAGRVAVITGGASGIGAAIADAYASKGAVVVILDLDADAAGTKASLLGDGHSGHGCDVSDEASVSAAVEEILGQHERVDVLVNSAGVALLGAAEELSAAAWDTTMNVNLRGTFLVCRGIGRSMLERGSGKIINLASQAGSVALTDHAAYCASKFGVIGLTKVLASEWAGRGVTVNTISPTVVLTELGKKAWAGQKGADHRALIPTGRFAHPEEVAAAAVFLASSGADMVNGLDLVVDGGYTIR